VTNDDHDARLIAAVRRAAADAIAPDAVEARVGRAATLKNWRDADGNRRLRVEIIPDRAEGQGPLPLADAREVVYFTRGLHDADGNPRVVGIIWRDGHAPEIFLGAVLPP
jgi:hypothetical protein